MQEVSQSHRFLLFTNSTVLSTFAFQILSKNVIARHQILTSREIIPAVNQKGRIVLMIEEVAQSWFVI